MNTIVSEMDHGQIGTVMSGDPMAIMNEIETGKMTANSVCPFPYNQPILNYLILYGMPKNREGAAKAMKYVIEQGADVNFGAPNGVCKGPSIYDVRKILGFFDPLPP